MEPPSLFNVVSGLALALTFGGMTFFSAVMAPLVFTKLPIATAGTFIRQLFPWYYLTMGISTLMALSALMLAGKALSSLETVLTTLVFIGFVFARQWLMPTINRARDAELAGDYVAGQRFKRLHSASVAINGLQWLAILATLVLVLM